MLIFIASCETMETREPGLYGTFEERLAYGLAAYEIRDYVTALKVLKPLAEKYDPSAAYILGEIYGYAQGVQQDYKEAFKWYWRSGIQGYPRAQMVLASFYDGGVAVEKDRWHALQWYQCVYENEKSSAKDKFTAGLYIGNAFNFFSVEVECHLDD